MYNYHADIVWKIDAILLAGCLALAALIIINMIIREYLWKRRSRALLGIKENVYEMILSGKGAGREGSIRLLSSSTPQQFLDVSTNRNRELIFFNDSEQEMFKKYYLSPQNLSRLKKIAAGEGDKWRRIEAIMALGYAGAADAVSILKKGLFSKNEDISYFSMISLGQLKSIEASRPLIEFFKKNPLWRYKLVAILENFPAETIEAIIMLTRDKDPSVRSWAVKLMSKFDLTGHINEMKAMIKDNSPDVRAAVCECLGRSGLKSAEDILIIALKDDSWLVRASAAKALSGLLGKKCVPAVAKLATDGSLSVINTVKDIFVSYIDEAIVYVQKFLESGDGMAQQISVEILERSNYIKKILEMLISPDEQDKRRAEHLISGMLKAGAHTGLEGAVELFDERSRVAIIAGMEKIDPGFAEYIDRKMKGDINE